MKAWNYIKNYFDQETGQEYSTIVQIIVKADRGKSIAWRSVSCLNRRRYSRFGGGWSPRRNDGHRFLQVDFQALAKVTRVATQGMQNANYWVKKYYIKYSRRRTGFATYREGRTTKVCFTYLCDVKASSPDFAQTVRGRSFQGDHLNTSYWLSKFFHRIGRFICISFFCRFSVETMIDTSPWKIDLPGFSMENTSEFTLFLGTLGLAWGWSFMDVCTVRFHLSGEVSWSLTWNEKCRGNCTLTELNFKSDSVWQKVKETSMWSPNFESFFYEISYEKVDLTYLDPEITNCAWSIIWKGRLSWLEHSTQYHNSESFRFPDTITQIFSNQFLFH